VIQGKRIVDLLAGEKTTPFLDLHVLFTKQKIVSSLFIFVI